MFWINGMGGLDFALKVSFGSGLGGSGFWVSEIGFFSLWVC